MKNRQQRKQIPPLGYGMTTKEHAMANADPLRDDNKRTGNSKDKDDIQGSFDCVAHEVP
jgi:hypothetical protein